MQGPITASQMLNADNYVEFIYDDGVYLNGTLVEAVSGGTFAWVVPDRVRQLLVDATAQGGGGGGGFATAGGGGGGGGSGIQLFGSIAVVVSGSTITLTLQDGGAGGAIGSAGSRVATSTRIAGLGGYRSDIYLPAGYAGQPGASTNGGTGGYGGDGSVAPNSGGAGAGGVGKVTHSELVLFGARSLSVTGASGGAVTFAGGGMPPLYANGSGFVGPTAAGDGTNGGGGAGAFALLSPTQSSTGNPTHATGGTPGVAGAASAYPGGGGGGGGGNAAGGKGGPSYVRFRF